MATKKKNKKEGGGTISGIVGVGGGAVPFARSAGRRSLALLDRLSSFQDELKCVQHTASDANEHASLATASETAALPPERKLRRRTVTGSESNNCPAGAAGKIVANLRRPKSRSLESDSLRPSCCAVVAEVKEEEKDSAVMQILRPKQVPSADPKSSGSRPPIDPSEMSNLIDDILDKHEEKGAKGRTASASAPHPSHNRRSSLAMEVSSQPSQQHVQHQQQQRPSLQRAAAPGGRERSTDTIDPNDLLWSQHSIAFAVSESVRALDLNAGAGGGASFDIEEFTMPLKGEPSASGPCCPLAGASSRGASRRSQQQPQQQGPSSQEERGRGRMVRRMSSGHMYLAVLEDWNRRMDEQFERRSSELQDEQDKQDGNTVVTGGSGRTICDAADLLWSNGSMDFSPSQSVRALSLETTAGGAAAAGMSMCRTSLRGPGAALHGGAF